MLFVCCPCCKCNKVSSQESNMSSESSAKDPDVLAKVTPLMSELKSLASPELYQEAKHLEEDYQKMPDRMHILEKFIRSLNNELKKHKSPEQKGGSSNNFPFIQRKLKVFPVVAAAKTFGADKEILKKVKVNVCSNPMDSEVVVLFCSVISRIGSDVDDAMRNIPDSLKTKQVILVVMHHTRKDINLTEAQLNHGHQNVKGTVHVLFHETVNGLLKCERNDRAIQDLQDLCKAITKSQDSSK